MDNIKFFLIGAVIGFLILMFLSTLKSKEKMEDSRISSEDIKVVFEQRYKDSVIDPSNMNDDQLKTFQANLKDHKQSGLIFNDKFQCNDANDWLHNREPSSALGEKYPKIDTTYMLAPIEVAKKQCPTEYCSFSNNYCVEKGYQKDREFTQQDELNNLYIDMLVNKDD